MYCESSPSVLIHTSEFRVLKSYIKLNITYF